jgi:hypothetical protein
VRIGFAARLASGRDHALAGAIAGGDEAADADPISHGLTGTCGHGQPQPRAADFPGQGPGDPADG